MQRIGIISQRPPVGYPQRAPFNPPERYPEIAYGYESDTTNSVYPMVRDVLFRLGMDKERFGTKEWNPFGEIIHRGNKVVLKPNWVLDISQHGLDALITHMSLLRAVLDYAWIACGPDGKIDILESPIQSTRWDHLMDVTKAKETVAFLNGKGAQITIQDIRSECFVEKQILNIGGWRVKIFYRKKLNGTAHGYTTVDLGDASALHEIESRSHLLRGIQQWAAKETRKAHNHKNHRYKIPNEILESNVFINIPKLKTHRKSGVTLTLKNLVGIADKKDWLPHYLSGTPEEGGDEAPKKREPIIRFIDAVSIIRLFKGFGFSLRPPGVEHRWRKRIEEDLFELKNVRQANWYGGDTVWRMVYDLNMILLHADVEGQIHQQPQRRYFGLIDGIIGGEKFGPLDSLPKETGIILAGSDPVLLEFVGTRIMGFDEKKIKTLANLYKVKYPFGENNFHNLEIVTNDDRWKRLLDKPELVCFHFIPAPGWKGHIELGAQERN